MATRCLNHIYVLFLFIIAKNLLLEQQDQVSKEKLTVNEDDHVSEVGFFVCIIGGIDV